MEFSYGCDPLQERIRVRTSQMRSTVGALRTRQWIDPARLAALKSALRNYHERFPRVFDWVLSTRESGIITHQLSCKPTEDE